MSTAVRRARLETSKGRVERIRKIHGRSSVPWRRRASADSACIAVKGKPQPRLWSLGLNETQLQ